jgi:hypothetical protein
LHSLRFIQLENARAAGELVNIAFEAQSDRRDAALALALAQC